MDSDYEFGNSGGHMNGIHSNQFGHNNGGYPMHPWETAMLSAPADTPSTQVFRWSTTYYDFDAYNAQKWSKVKTSAWKQFIDELESVKGFKYPLGDNRMQCRVLSLIFFLMCIGEGVIILTVSVSNFWLIPVWMGINAIVMFTYIMCTSSDSNTKKMKRLSDIKAVIQRHNASTFHPVGYSVLLGSESAYFQLINNGMAAQHNGMNEQNQGFNQQPNYNQQQNFHQPGQYNTNPQQYNTYPQQPNYGNNVNFIYPSYPGNNPQKMYEMPLIQNVNINPT
jgi:hypothetical protein